LKILAFDTSGRAVTAALQSDDALLGEVFLNIAQNHSVTLMPMIKRLLNDTGVGLPDITHIACASGPGSFTGLRIGAGTAKALAYALEIPIAAVPTLDALAYNVFDAHSIIVPIMDARRGQVYTAFYRVDDERAGLERLTDYMAADISDVMAELPRFGKPAVFLGDAAPIYKDAIVNNSHGIKCALAPSPALLQRASSVAAIGARMARNGDTTDSASFAPFYLRKPQAERERERAANG